MPLEKALHRALNSFFLNTQRCKFAWVALHNSSSSNTLSCRERCKFISHRDGLYHALKCWLALMKQKPSESHEVHYITPFQTFWHEPLTFQRLFKSSSTHWHELVHATLTVCLQTGKHTNTSSECSWNHQLSGHKCVMHNRGGYTQELVKRPQQCTAVIVNTLCCNMFVGSQTDRFKVWYDAQDSSCIWPLQLSATVMDLKTWCCKNLPNGDGTQ